MKKYNSVLLFIFVITLNSYGESIIDDNFVFVITPEETLSVSYYKGNSDKVVIPIVVDDKRVTEIEGGIFNGAFTDKRITDVVIPSFVKKIGMNAFKGNNLKKITIGGGVELRGAFIDSFEKYYNDNGKKSGTYLAEENISYYTGNGNKTEMYLSGGNISWTRVETTVSSVEVSNRVTTTTNTHFLTESFQYMPQVNSSITGTRQALIERMEKEESIQVKSLPAANYTNNTDNTDSIILFIPNAIEPDNMRVHRAKPKESLTAIARRYYGEANIRYFPLIMFANNINNPDYIKIGDLIVIPDLKLNRGNYKSGLIIKEYIEGIAWHYWARGDYKMHRLLENAANEW